MIYGFANTILAPSKYSWATWFMLNPFIWIEIHTASGTARCANYLLVPRKAIAQRQSHGNGKISEGLRCHGRFGCYIPARWIGLTGRAHSRNIWTNCSQAVQMASLSSSNSQTPCPINCYGFGEFSDGDDGPEQVQCSSCDFWWHFRCQPEDGEVDWNDPNIIFTCQGCRQRTTAELCVPHLSYFSIN
jgi:hypothetical protein